MRGKAVVLFILFDFSMCFLNAAALSVPERPLGLKGVRDPLGRTFTVLWEPVNRTESNLPLTHLSGYNIYRRTSLRGPATKINPYVLTIPVYADRIDGKIFYYTVRAVDTNDAESADSMVVDSTPQANVIFLAADGRTDMTIPGHIADLLRPAHNKYNAPLDIHLIEEAVPDGGNIIRSLRFQLVRGDTRQDIGDLAFHQPDVNVRIGYNLIGNRVGLGPPNAGLHGVLPATNTTPDQLSLFWFNGVAWINMGGGNDDESQTMVAATSQLGRYQLRVGAPAQSLILDNVHVYPGLFTPNGDGFNDRVYFVVENPTNALVRGEIFDPSGRRISPLSTSEQSMGPGTSLVWNGTDAHGDVVPSGLYIYRLEGEGQTLTGTVSVAR